MTLAIPAPEPKEIDPDRNALLRRARDEVKKWQAEVDRLAGLIQAELGDASSATVNGVEVARYDYIEQWRGGDLRKDYPELTEHYMETSMKFNPVNFARHHPEIARKYQTRKFTLK